MIRTVDLVALDLHVDRSSLTRTRLFEAPPSAPTGGQALLRVDRFALTSNNATYAVLGDTMGYWRLFPAAAPWGRVPVWGFAEVVASHHDDLDEGTWVFGFLPMSTELLVSVTRASEHGFVDRAPHRADLPGAYQWYQRVAPPSSATGARDDHHALFRPLFLLSFLLAEHLHDNRHLGATSVVLSSASSKAALGTAARLARLDGVTAVGLTSPGRAPFVERLGLYDQVATYEEVAELPTELAAYLDFAGDLAINAAIDDHFGAKLVLALRIGGTHQHSPWIGEGAAAGAGAEVFFAPEVLAARIRQWGRRGFEDRFEEAWNQFVAVSDQWLTVVHDRGPEAVRTTWLDLLTGTLDPAVGHIGSLTP